MVSLSQQQQQQQQQQYTLGFLKPDVMDRITEIMELIKAKSLWNVTFETELCLSVEEAKALYPQDDTALWLSSHSIHVFILKGPNVVKNWYKYAGPKDSTKAKQVSPQSLRAIYGMDDIQNVCHASSSDKEAQRDLTWLQNLIPDYRLSIPLDTGSASLSEQRHHAAPSSTNLVAASKFNTTSMTSHPAAPAPAKSKHLSTTSNFSPPSSPLSSLPGTKKKSSTKQLMALSRPNPSLGTPLKESKVARQEIKATRPKGRLVPLSNKPSSDSAKTMGYKNTKHLSNIQDPSKANPGVSLSPKHQQPQKLSQTEKQRKDTVPADNNYNNNNAHTQPLQQKHTNESNNSSKLGNDNMVESPVALSPIDDMLDCMHNDQSIQHDDNYPTTTASSSSTNSDISLASISTLTVDSDHDDDKQMTMPLSAITVADNCASTIRIISPTNNSINQHSTPDVDNLRHEFEALCQNKQAVLVPRTSSNKNSPYLASRIRDLKPKNPSGSRVKSMVAYFMDENLHKWEF